MSIYLQKLYPPIRLFPKGFVTVSVDISKFGGCGSFVNQRLTLYDFYAIKICSVNQVDSLGTKNQVIFLINADIWEVIGL